MTYSLHDRVTYQEIVGEAICNYAGIISGVWTVEGVPHYNVQLDLDGSIVQGVLSKSLRPERITMSDEVA